MLREGLRANVLTPEALQRIRQATEQEWRQVSRAPARRGWLALAAAASVAVLAAGLGWAYLAMNSASANAAILGEIASFDAPGMVEPRTLRPDLMMVAGSKLRVGLQTQAHRLLPRHTQKLAAYSQGMSRPDLVIDEVPDNATAGIDPVTGEARPLAGREGLQTNNPGWPCFFSAGWIVGGSFHVTLHY